MNVMELLTAAVEQNAADIFLIPGMPFSYKIGGRIIYQGDNRIMPDEMDKMITEIYGLAKNRGMDKVQSHGDDDFSFAIPGVSRFRASVFRQRGSLAGIIRVVRFELPDAGQLHLPDSIIGVSRLTKGMVLVTGPAKARPWLVLLMKSTAPEMPMSSHWRTPLNTCTGINRAW